MTGVPSRASDPPGTVQFRDNGADMGSPVPVVVGAIGDPDWQPGDLDRGSFFHLARGVTDEQRAALERHELTDAYFNPQELAALQLAAAVQAGPQVPDAISDE